MGRSLERIPLLRLAAICAGASIGVRLLVWGAEELVNPVALGDLLAVPELIIILGLLVAAPAGLVLLVFPGWRRAGLQVVIAGLCLLVPWIALSSLLPDPIDSHIDRVIYRSQPLIAALEHYERSTGRLPARLEDLVPTEMRSLPSIARDPAFTFTSRSSGVIAASGATSSPGGRGPARWQVTYRFAGFFDDQFLIYRPDRDYSDGFHGTTRRVGDWLLVTPPD